MLNRFFGVIAACVGILVLSSAARSQSSSEPQPAISNAIPVAYYYATTSQIGINPGDIVKLTTLGLHGKFFDITADGEAVVNKHGYYAVQFQALVSTQASLALFKNGEIVPDTAFANLATTSPITGNVVVFLGVGDTLSIRSIENYKSFNTMMPTTIQANSIPVAMTMQRFDN